MDYKIIQEKRLTTNRDGTKRKYGIKRGSKEGEVSNQFLSEINIQLVDKRRRKWPPQ